MTWWRTRATTLVVAIFTAAGFAAVVPHLRFTTKITEFVPDSQERSVHIAALLAQSDTARVMVIDLSLEGSVAAPESLRAAARSLIDFLQGLPEVARVTSGFTERDVTAVLEFLRSWPATAFVPTTVYSNAEIRTRLSELRDALASPLGVIARQVAPRDPLGGVWRTLRELQAFQSTAIIDDDGILVTNDRRHAFVFVETKASPFDSDRQRQFRVALNGWRMRAVPSSVRLQTAGAAQFAIASESQIKRDVNRIGIASTVGIIAIFLLLFGSVRMIVVGFVPMVFGSVVAVAVCHAWFGEIHGITIAFATSLLGVGLDYTEHYFAHFALTPTDPAVTTMRRVAPSIALGALTTVIGFAGIAASGLPGLRQMALFSVIAIAASLAATYWIVPAWMPAGYQPPRSLGIVHRCVVALLQRVQRVQWSITARVAVVAGAMVALAVGFGRAQFLDNVNMLVDESGPHAAEDRAVRSRAGSDLSGFAVITAATDDALMVAIGSATAELRDAKAHGAVTSFLSLGAIAPSAAEQVARWEAARANIATIRAAMAELDFVPSQFQPFWDELASGPRQRLTLADVRNSALAPLVRAWLPSPSAMGPTATIPLVGVSDLAALRARVPSASIVVPAETMVGLFRSVRTSTIAASTIGFAAIALLLFARYRSGRKVAVALTPALLACIATAATLAGMGIALTILHVMALLLVVSLGVDFGIFLVDAAASVEESARTLVSILTASVTTLLSFGLLSASQSPGLAALGLTITLGVTYSLFLCFLLASLAARNSQRKRIEA